MGWGPNFRPKPFSQAMVGGTSAAKVEMTSGSGKGWAFTTAGQSA